MRVRSLVGLIPIFAVEVPRYVAGGEHAVFHASGRLVLASIGQNLPQLVSRWNKPGADETPLLVASSAAFRITKLLERVLDPNEFLSAYGVRALSRYHLEHPYVFEADGFDPRSGTCPGESDTDLFGGNSNWRGPIWIPMNYLILESLSKFDQVITATTSGSSALLVPARSCR